MHTIEKLGKIGLLAIILFAGSASHAQEQSQAPMPMEGMDQANEMQEMARAMKSMAEMCQMMMQREAQLRPYWMTAICVVGVLLALALVLFIVLEVQWIRFWNLRIGTERKNLGSS